MNERIKELAEQAGAKVHLEQTRSGDWVDFSDYTGFDYKKFAQLIVKECIQVCGPEDSFTDEWFKAKADSVAKIKQLFGVEE